MYPCITARESAREQGHDLGTQALQSKWIIFLCIVTGLRQKTETYSAEDLHKFIGVAQNQEI